MNKWRWMSSHLWKPLPVSWRDYDREMFMQDTLEVGGEFQKDTCNSLVKQGIPSIIPVKPHKWLHSFHKMFLIFTSTWRTDRIWLTFFSDGLKSPTNFGVVNIDTDIYCMYIMKSYKCWNKHSNRSSRNWTIWIYLFEDVFLIFSDVCCILRMVFKIIKKCIFTLLFAPDPSSPNVWWVNPLVIF